VSEAEVPHVSNRPTCWDLRDGWQGADYLLYDDRSGAFGNDQAVDATGKGPFHLVARRHHLVLLGKS
jgi:hypothetical protein